jgi:anti-sigma regulatory factor (Ser/Thr protein kinase)
MGHRFECPFSTRCCVREQDYPDALLYRVSVRSVLDSRSAAAVARRAALRLGFGTPHAGSVAIAASELATNIARHAQAGLIHVHGCDGYVKVIAQDRGPGFANVDAALLDRHSGGRQLGSDDPWREGIGCGLGAVRRLMDQVDIRSTLGVGTCVMALKKRPEKCR